MAYPQATVRFGDLAGIVDASFTLSHGVSPSVCTITCAPQPIATAEGTLTFLFGGSPVFTMPACRIDSAQIARDGRGFTMQMAILDRRWKWVGFGTISGVYNTRKLDGESLVIERERTPRELARLCLDALGETADLSGLPEGPRPEIDWDAESPAQALDKLVNDLGCRVVMRTDGSIRIDRLGVGATLPDAGALDKGDTLDLAERPFAIGVLGAKNRYQADFSLRAVGQDTDGEIKAIDELSYTPAAGWGKTSIKDFRGVGAGLAAADRDEARALAKRSVFRWYRIYANRDGSQPLKVPGYGALDNGFQILPIEDVQVVTYQDLGLKPPENAGQEDQGSQSYPALVAGVFADKTKGWANTMDGTRVKADFRINREQGIVEFSEPVYKFPAAGPGGGREPAELVLSCAVSVRDQDTWAWERFHFERILGGSATQTRWIKREDFQVNYLAGQQVGIEEVNKQANHYLDALEAEYAAKVPQQRKYAGILPIQPDGAIQQVGWSISGGVGTTQASRNNEFSLYVPSYRERRRFEQLRDDAVIAARDDAKRARRQLERR